MDKKIKIIVPGAAGLVGQNLILQLKERGYRNIIAIDKHPKNTEILKELHPDITVIRADVSVLGEWERCFENGDVVIMLQAQIGGLNFGDFIKNNIESTKVILSLMKKYGIPYVIHVSSSVVCSSANDFYTITKREQEKLVLESGISYCVLRPTLMFGWFDRKHLGWLARFMERVPVFPIPGDGKYVRQPLYVRDFCNIIISVLENKESHKDKVYNITGKEKIYYIDIIKTIKKVKGTNTLIVKIPYSLFYSLLKIYSLFSKNPPFIEKEISFFIIVNLFGMLQTYIISVGLAKYVFPAINFTCYSETIAHIVGLIIPVFTSFLGHKYLSFREAISNEEIDADCNR